jgi:hypothetical protein
MHFSLSLLYGAHQTGARMLRPKYGAVTTYEMVMTSKTILLHLFHKSGEVVIDFGL